MGFQTFIGYQSKHTPDPVFKKFGGNNQNKGDKRTEDNLYNQDKGPVFKIKDHSPLSKKLSNVNAGKSGLSTPWKQKMKERGY